MSAALAVVAVLLSLPAGGPVAGAQETPELLLPDLKTRRPKDLSVQRRSTATGNQKLLRFSNEIVNQGRGPLEVPTGGECPGQDPETHRLASQNVFEDTNGNEVFDRGSDEIASTEVVGCTELHSTHGHYHLQEFALYELRRFNPDGSVGDLVAGSAKVGFCLVDTLRRKPHLASSPVERFYGRDSDCEKDGLTGISIGWSDIYGANLPHQWIEIGGVPPGTYCLRSIADPADKITELNDTNNKRGLKLRLYRRTVDFIPRRPCIEPS